LLFELRQRQPSKISGQLFSPDFQQKGRQRSPKPQPTTV
jgi:hypothetical protein